MSYPETAVYTKSRFNLPETAEEIAQEWTDMAIREYAERVPLKHGAKEAVEALAARGIPMAITTALRREVYEPCLRRHGIYDYFEFALSTEEAGASKADGALFTLAAKKLNVAPKDIWVFDDVYPAIRGAKAAGMHAYCVIDSRSTHEIDKVMELADAYGKCIIMEEIFLNQLNKVNNI
jgi:HAD superfamily hydrolase (TIGR01509 family)